MFIWNLSNSAILKGAYQIFLVETDIVAQDAQSKTNIISECRPTSHQFIHFQERILSFQSSMETCSPAVRLPIREVTLCRDGTILLKDTFTQSRDRTILLEDTFTQSRDGAILLGDCRTGDE
jgi:hypothetical protein